ncbi:alanine racemase [Bdellovibrionota bacterium]
MSHRYRPTVVEIDLEALRHNFQQAKLLIHPKSEVLGVVKANAYGHGDSEVAATLADEGIDYLGVAIIEEAEQLREEGIKTPIVVLTGIEPSQFRDVIKNNVIPVMWQPDNIEVFHQYLERNDLTSPIYIKVDTGMHRLGITFDQFPKLCRSLKEKSRFELKCLMTHLAISEKPDSSLTQSQLSLFAEAIEIAREHNLNFQSFAFGNSGAVIHKIPSSFAKPEKMLVRPGIMLYGSYPSPEMRSQVSLKPVMHYKTGIIGIKRVKKGESVGYGGTYRAPTDISMGILPVGYADGYNRLLSNKAEVLVGGRRVPVIGNVSMDLTTVDLSGVPDAKIGDEVVLFGTQGDEWVSAWELAQLCGTISYEVFCSVSPRVPRIYRDISDFSHSRRGK